MAVKERDHEMAASGHPDRVAAGGATLAQGDVRVEQADVEHPALVAGPDGAQLVMIIADRRALRSALDDGMVVGALGAALSTVVADLERDLASAGSV